jgi:L-lysine exporter family protein LysE/ArgO
MPYSIRHPCNFHLPYGDSMSTDLIAGFLSGAALIIAIGAQNSFVLRQGIRREHVLPVVLVCASADALLIVLGIAGLGALIQRLPIALDIARYGGAAFLLAYGVAAARRALQAHDLLVDSGVGTSLKPAMATCLAFTFLNPHVYLDTVILLGSLASQRGDSGRWVFGGGAATASFVWFFALGYGARLLGPLFARPIAWRVLDSLIALIMWALGLGLLLG